MFEKCKKIIQVMVYNPALLFNSLMCLLWSVASFVVYDDVTVPHYQFWLFGFFVGGFLGLSMWSYWRVKEHVDG